MQKTLSILFLSVIYFIGNTQTDCLTVSDTITESGVKTQSFCNSNSFLSNYKVDKGGINQYDQTPIYTVKLKSSLA